MQLLPLVEYVIEMLTGLSLTFREKPCFKRINLMFFIVLLSFISLPVCFAGTAHDEYRKIQKEISKQKKKIEEIKHHESSILFEIENVNKQIKQAEEQLRKYKNKLSETESKISKLEYEINDHLRNIQKHKDWLKRKLIAIYRYGNSSDTLMLLLNSEDISQLIRKGKYLQYISVYEHNLIEKYRNSLQELSEKEKRLSALKKELENNQKKVKSEEENLTEKKNQKETMLATVRKQYDSHKRVLKELEDASNRILEIIRESERKEKGKEYIPEGVKFAKLKGRLPWPVEGKVALPYGSQRDPQFNTPIFRSGAFIQSALDAYAKAVYNGKVVFAEWFKGYGQLVIINHGDGYHTLYGSLSEIFVKVGDIIKSKQAIGKIGMSGLMSSPGLYFELRYKGKPLDPLQWLQRR